MSDVRPWVQEAVSAEHFVRKCTEELIGYPSLGKDTEASLLVQRIQDLAEKHLGRIETLPSRIDEQPSALREKLNATTRPPATMSSTRDRPCWSARPVAAILALEHLRDYAPAIQQLVSCLHGARR